MNRPYPVLHRLARYRHSSPGWADPTRKRWWSTPPRSCKKWRARPRPICARHPRRSRKMGQSEKNPMERSRRLVFHRSVFFEKIFSDFLWKSPKVTKSVKLKIIKYFQLLTLDGMKPRSAHVVVMGASNRLDSINVARRNAQKQARYQRLSRAIQTYASCTSPRPRLTWPSTWSIKNFDLIIRSMPRMTIER